MQTEEYMREKLEKKFEMTEPKCIAMIYFFV
jgi:hypothetical protein